VTILLIEDDALVRDVVVDMLKILGHTVIATAGGRQGVARLEAGDPVDVVLTDLKMPGMSGWEVVRAVRERWPALPIGIITGNPDLLSESPELVGVVIRKPVSLEVLREAIKRLRQ